MSPFGRQLLSRSKLWLSDGTFECAPAPFVQLYVVATQSPSNQILPACYFLLQDKTSESYNRLWEEVKQQLPDDRVDGPETLKIDFELGACNTFKAIFHESKVCCYFYRHFELFSKI
jgi:hypothetical protein